MKNFLWLPLLLVCLPWMAKPQSSLYMPGPTNWVSVGDLDVAGNQLTVEALIHYTGAAVNIVSKHTDPSNVNYLLRIGVFEITTTNGYANFGGVAASGVTFVPNRTYHVAATYDGQFLRYYVNGCQTGQMAWSGNMIQTNLLTAIGNQSNCQCEQFTGYIDEVRIWNIARTQAQIAGNMLDLPNPPAQAGLMGYWKFDGTHVNLQGNAAFNGTPVGAPQFQLIPYPLPSVLHASATASDPICSGESNGLINASSSGSYSPHEYSLDGINYSTNPVFPNLSAGSYTVYIRPQNTSNCLLTRTVVLSDPPALNPNLSSTNVACAGGNNGTATVTPAGGNGPAYNQLWSPQSATTTTVNNLPPGNYSVTISDSCKSGGPELVANGTFDNGAVGFTSDYTHCLNCIAVGNNLNEGQYLVVADASVHHVNFVGTGNGGGGNFLNVNGGSTPNSSVWCQSIPVNPNTWYFFSTWVTSLHPTSPASLQFSINGNVLGVPFIAPSSTSTWVRFFTSWFSGSMTSANICIVNQNTQLVGNDFGLDDISFKECLSCEVNVPYTITEPLPIQIQTQENGASCNGGSNGSATVNPGGGTGPFSYLWNTAPVQTSQTATNLSAGSYTVTVSDANSCTQTTTVIITEPPAIQLSTVQSNVPCAGGSVGSATVNAAGGTGPYNYSWNTAPVQTMQTASNLAAGTYTVIVTDAQNCTQVTTVTIIESSAIQLTTQQTDVTCAGGNSGSATVNAVGGTSPYSYSWNTVPVQTTASAFNLGAGTYNVLVTDAQNCTQATTVTITEPLSIQLSTVQTNVPCAGGNGGIATVTASGGSGAYAYSWSTTPVLSTPTATGLVAGMYTVTVTDAQNCSQSTSIAITEPPAIQLSTVQADVPCAGGNDGSATVNPAGGTGPFSYLWNTAPVQTSQTATNLSAGSYTVTVSDANSCTQTTTVIITEPPAIQLSTVQSNVPCAGGSVGTATVNATGGTGPYTYLWSTTPAQTTQTAGNLSVGTYTVTVTDDSGCTQDASVGITQPAAMQINATVDSVSCAGGNDGQITLNMTGGTPPYSYLWTMSPVQSSSTATNLTQGSYPVTVTDQVGCTLSSVFTVSEPSALTLAITNRVDPRCIDSNDGSISISAIGGTGTYSFTWNPAVSVSGSASNLGSGIYQATVTDLNNCSSGIVVTLNQPAALITTISANPIQVCAGQTTTLLASTTGGTGSITYLWNTGSMLSSSTVLPSGSSMYVVTVEDSLNCTATDSIFIDVIALEVDLGQDTTLCTGTPYLLDPGSGFASYLWQDGSIAPVFQAIQSGQYHVLVADTNGCTATDTVLVMAHPASDPGLPASVEFCPGSGAIITAAPGFISYLWSNGATSTSIPAVSAGAVTVTVRDVNGCLYSDTTIVTIHRVPVLQFDVQPRNGCAPLEPIITNTSSLNGSVITAWQWSMDSQTSSLFEPRFTISTPGLYSISLQVTTADGCISDTTLADIVEVYPVPNAKGTPTQSIYDGFDREITIINESTDADSYQWFLDSDFLGTSTDLISPIGDSGRFVFELIASNMHGCTDTTRIPVRVMPGATLYFPNAFTPNGNELNEAYSPKGIGIKEYRMLIFNRWGELIFESDSIAAGWDGTYRGIEAEQDTYVYKCEVVDFRDKKYGYTGTVHLIR